MARNIPRPSIESISPIFPDTVFLRLGSPIGEDDVMVVGKRKPFLNSKVDVKKLQKYEEQFKAYQEKYKN
ncbi:hypothetical protein AKG34_08245 [Peribacillus butanolivorans]|nr:hypothetical protein AKG34_08245 [Peribacillus butanolivorans]